MKALAAFLVGVAIGWVTWDSVHDWAVENRILEP